MRARQPRPSRSRYAELDFQVGQVFNDLVGKTIVVRLTVTDLIGNKASDDVKIRLVR